MLSPEQIDAIERDAGSGLSLTEIARKHKVAIATAKRYAPNAVSKKGRRPGKSLAGGGSMKPAKQKKQSVGRFSAAIENLRSERDRIDAIIQQLEALA
jgi:hypothetical protein